MNLVKKIALIAVCAMLGFQFVSCNDDNDELLNNNLNGGILNSKVATSPCNSLNPYDSVGILHNQHLTNVFDDLYSLYQDPNILEVDTINSYAREYLSSKYNEVFISDIVDTRIYRCNTDEELLSTMVNLGFSNAAISVVNSTVSTIENITNNSYRDYYNAIYNIEKNVISRTDLSQSEKEIILCFTSVYRHSIYYWYEGKDASSKAKVPKWLQVAAADGKGALAGAGTGAAAGAVVGGAPGAAAGAIAGGVVGAAAASIEKAAELDKIKKPENEKPNSGQN